MPVFKELPGVKESDESTIPLTSCGTEDAGVSDNIANGSHPRVPYGEKLRAYVLFLYMCFMCSVKLLHINALAL